MCELFAMSSREPSAVTYSLNEFAENGSSLRANRSGWGIAYAHDRDAFVVKEAAPAAVSPWVKFIGEQHLESKYVMAHVRYATRGEPTLENTHPFRRAMGGQVHLFAHNGTLEDMEELAGTCPPARRPIGSTDTELAFCLLLLELESLWGKALHVPPVAERFDVFAGFAATMMRRGPSNFLYFDGDALFVHAHKRIYDEGNHLTEPRAPGLHMKLCADDATKPTFDWKGLHIDQPEAHSVLFASVPLDDEGWEPLPEGTALVVKDGVEVAREATR